MLITEDPKRQTRKINLIASLSPEAKQDMERMLRLRFCIPYVRDRIETVYGERMSTGTLSYREFCKEHDIPWIPTASGRLSFAVSSVLDPEQKWRQMFFDMVSRQETLGKMLRTLRSHDAPVFHRDALKRAIGVAGWDYGPHKPGGKWCRGVPKTKRNLCPQCGEPVKRNSRKHCSPECHLKTIREKMNVTQ